MLPGLSGNRLVVSYVTGVRQAGLAASGDLDIWLEE